MPYGWPCWQVSSSLSALRCTLCADCVTPKAKTWSNGHLGCPFINISCRQSDKAGV